MLVMCCLVAIATVVVLYVLERADTVRFRSSGRDCKGKTMADLLNGVQITGCHRVRFDGSGLASGAYSSPRGERGDWFVRAVV